MKRTLLLPILLLCISVCASAQTKDKPSDKNDRPSYGVSFCNGVNIPDGYKFIPAPPGRGEALWTVDSLCYEQGKELRATERGAQAVEDAKTGAQFFMDKISPIIGIKLTVKEFPELAKLIKGTVHDVRDVSQNAKDKYARHRPYQVFGEHTSIPKSENPKDFTSYPSGHSTRGWALGLLMTTLDPEHSDAYLKMGYELGQSRVIVGYHFQSDVDAARLCASAGYARLWAEKSFRKQFRKAQKELNKSREKH